MKTIIVTGANGNLGVAVVKKFLDEGYNVVGIDFSGTNLEQSLHNPGFELHSVDLTDEEAVESFANAAIKKFGSIDGAFLLAGGFAMGGIHTVTNKEIQKMFTLNFETAFNISRVLFPHMLKNGHGRLVFIGARPALIPAQGKGMMAYSLTKSLLFNYADMLNEEARGKDVVASVIVPSTIDTELNRKSMPDADPANWVKPCQLADVMEFITSAKGSVLRETVLKVYNNS
ncbi:MAG TPA: SDR family NAD(P)-dependent oxidoreductase [Chitinophagaceae bacterium]